MPCDSKALFESMIIAKTLPLKRALSHVMDNKTKLLLHYILAKK